MKTLTQRRSMWIALALVGAGLLLATTATQPHALADEQAPALKVGTYEPQELFAGYHGRTAFMQQMTQLEQRMQQAQQEQDQQQMMQVQQEAEQARDQVLQQFQQEVAQAMPDVARDQGVQLVAVQIVYVDDAVQREDLTQPLLAKINENADAEAPAAPALPGLD